MQDLSTRVKKVHGLPFFLCGLSVVLENKLEQLSKVHKQVEETLPVKRAEASVSPSRSLQDMICHCRPPSAAASEPESLTKRTSTTTDHKQVKGCLPPPPATT
ncbi:hypothetical protein INR49_022568, partial [Caranx melampygus]